MPKNMNQQIPSKIDRPLAPVKKDKLGDSTKKAKKPKGNRGLKPLP